MTDTSHNLLNIDGIAQKSKLSNLNPEFKILIGFLSLILCISINSYLIFVVISVTMIVSVIYLGGLRLREYIPILKLPLTFLFFSSLAILFRILKSPDGIMNIPFFKGYLSITHHSLVQAFKVSARAFCGITCLFMISLTTPISDIIGVLRRMKVPNIMIELMYLIYRYMMILIEMNSKMTVAAASRQGYGSMKASYRSMLGIASNLLVLSFRKASISFDAMEARGYDGHIEFWQEEKKLQRKEIIAGTVYVAVLALVILIERAWL